MLTCICIHKHISSCLLEGGVNMTDTHTNPCSRLIACTNIHTPRGASLWHASKSAFLSYTQVAAYWRARITDTHTRPCSHLIAGMYKHPYLRLTACTNSHTPQGAPLFHTYWSVSLACIHSCTNLHTHYASVERVFIVEMAILRTVLWDIRARDSRFLVLFC